MASAAFAILLGRGGGSDAFALFAFAASEVFSETVAAVVLQLLLLLGRDGASDALAIFAFAASGVFSGTVSWTVAAVELQLLLLFLGRGAGASDDVLAVDFAFAACGVFSGTVAAVVLLQLLLCSSFALANASFALTRASSTMGWPTLPSHIADITSRSPGSNTWSAAATKGRHVLVDASFFTWSMSSRSSLAKAASPQPHRFNSSTAARSFSSKLL